MALAKDHMPSELTPNTLLLSNSFYEDNHGSAGSSTQVSDLSSQGSYAYDEYKNAPPLDEEDINNMKVKYKPDSISMNPKARFSYSNNRAQDVHSLINFNSGTDQSMQGSESLLSFEQSRAISNKNEAFMWKNNGTMSYNNQLLKQTSGLDSHLYEEIRCGFGSINTPKANVNHGETGCSWLYSDSMAVADTFQEKGTQEPPGFHKRPYPGESIQALKKQCTSTTRSNSPKAKNASSKDPQSIAAKNRRERISERLKILQELVPNGTKVDLVTMLEKAISYVKFLQLQVKVLATDEFWPAQGGKAPDIAQVKEAIDAILSSHRDRNSSSSSK